MQYLSVCWNLLSSLQGGPAQDGTCVSDCVTCCPGFQSFALHDCHPAVQLIQTVAVDTTMMLVSSAWEVTLRITLTAACTPSPNANRVLPSIASEHFTRAYLCRRVADGRDWVLIGCRQQFLLFVDLERCPQIGLVLFELIAQIRSVWHRRTVTFRSL